MKTSDLIYLETDDSCAICGAKGIGILTKHHIDSNRSNNEYDNLILYFPEHDEILMRGKFFEQAIKSGDTPWVTIQESFEGFEYVVIGRL